MRKYPLLLSFLLMAFLSQAQFSKDVNIKLSYYQAFGALPNQAELNYWMGQPSYTVSQLVSSHKNYLKSSKDYRERAIRKSYMYVFGRVPKPAELQYWMGQNYTFNELRNTHVNFLSSNANEWLETIYRAYLFVFNSAPTMEEVNRWKRSPMSFIDLTDRLEATRSSRSKSYSVQSVSTNVSRPTLSKSSVQLGSEKVSLVD